MMRKDVNICESFKEIVPYANDKEGFDIVHDRYKSYVGGETFLGEDDGELLREIKDKSADDERFDYKLCQGCQLRQDSDRDI